MDYKRLHALVTGGIGVIGKAIITALLERKAAKVCVLDISSDGESVVKELSDKFPSSQIEFYKADVTDYQQFKDCIKWCVEKFGYLNLLVNNAGIGALDSDIEQISLLHRINLEAVFYGTQLATEVMNPKNGGKGGMIINTASMAGLELPSIHSIAYSATKAGVIHLTRVAGMPENVEKTNIKVNCVCPAFVESTIVDTLGCREIVSKMDQTDILTPEFVAEGFIKVLESGESGQTLKIIPKQDYKYHTFTDPLAED